MGQKASATASECIQAHMGVSFHDHMAVPVTSIMHW